MSLPPIHPILVHFPIAFYFLELFLLALWLLKNEDHYRNFSLLVFRLSFFTMLAAMIAGWIDAGGWEGIQGKVRLHFYGAVFLGAIQSARALYWHLEKPSSRRQAWICFAGALLGCVAVIFTSYIGGEMVYG